MKMYRYLFISAVVLLSACKHSQDCPGFTNEDTAWMVYDSGDTVKFVNAAGSRITFAIESQHIDPSYSEECGRGEPMGYYCRPCRISAGVTGASDTSRRNYKGLSTGLLKEDDHQEEFCVSVFDHYATFPFDFKTHSITSALSLDTLTLGGTLYRNVYVDETDTGSTSAVAANILVWKIYYNKQFGILGFHDRQTNSVFYRQ